MRFMVPKQVLGAPTGSLCRRPGRRMPARFWHVQGMRHAKDWSSVAWESRDAVVSRFPLILLFKSDIFVAMCDEYITL